MREMMMTAMGEVRRRSRTTSTMSATASPRRRATSTTASPRNAASTARPHPKEVKALVEDGVRVAPLPPAAPKKSEVN
jgi:hypothetical protein